MSKQWVIVGSYLDMGTTNGIWIDEEVATFDTKQMALDYIEKSRLKSHHRHRVFKKSSLLYPYEDAYMQERMFFRIIQR